MSGRRMMVVLAVSGLALAACSGSDAGSGGGSAIEISGSSTVEPITSLVAEAFRAGNSDVQIGVNGPGTGDGFQLFCNGETDVSDASRQIKPEEIATCADNDVEYVELTVGIDGITVATSPANSGVECLDAAAIYALVGPESTGFGSWADASDLADEVGSARTAEFPDAPLDITGPGEESGTYDTFVELVVAPIAEERGQDTETRPDYQSSKDDNVIVEGIRGSDSSFGWVGYAFYAANEDVLSSIAIDGGEGCVRPAPDTIADGSYPLARPLYIYVNAASAAANPALADFVDFYLSDSGYSAVAEAGYVQLTDDAWSETLAAWESR